jgi:hypothetical protein
MLTCSPKPKESSNSSNGSFHNSQERIIDLECKLDEKEVLIIQLKESLERERNNRKLSEEGKDEFIFELEKKLEEAGMEFQRAANALEEERNRRKENERLLDRLSNAHKEAVERAEVFGSYLLGVCLSIESASKKADFDGLSKATRYNELEAEKKRLNEIIRTERELWNK